MRRRDPAITSRIMSAVRNRDTAPEMLLRRELHRRGLRYRLHARIIGKPDLVFPGSRVAVFVDGDWWHGNSWRLRGHADFDSQFDNMTNADFWRTKIAGNMVRDARVNAALHADGWRVLRLWESDVRADLTAAADKISAALRETGRRQSGTGQ